MTNINETLTKIDTGFNLLNSIPFVANYTVPYRFVYGFLQYAIGGTILGAGMLGQAAQPHARQWQDITAKGAHHKFHGELNLVRSCVEYVGAITIIGSLYLLIGQLAYQHMVSSKKFAPIISYNRALSI